MTLLKGQKTKYRALVTDISLKGRMDGWEVVMHAREIDPQFPIVYMSGARRVRWRGIFAAHTWIVVKERRAYRYSRYGYTSWGSLFASMDLRRAGCSRSP